MIEDSLRLRLSDDRGERGDIGLLDGLQAAEMFEQSSCCRFADAGNLAQFGGAVADLPTLAVESHCKAVGFVADLLHQMQHGRMMVEHDGIIFLSIDVDDLFSFGDGRQRLIDDLESFERLGSGMQLPQATVDQHQAWHGLLFFAQALVASRDHLAHGGEIVDASRRS